MADRERSRAGDDPGAAAYYDGVSDGLVLAAETVEALDEPASSLGSLSDGES